jgi:DNA-binding MurR/RpiR family transcriptional regulator
MTPYPPAINNLTRIAAKRKVPVIAFTDCLASPVAPAAKVHLEIDEAEDCGIHSLSATICAAMALAVAAGARRREIA